MTVPSLILLLKTGSRLRGQLRNKLRGPRVLWLLARAAILLSLAGCTETPHDMVARGETKRIEELLARDPSAANAANALGKTPLHYAVTMRRIDLMDLLARHGANLDAADRTGMTPLHVAAMMGRAKEAEWLLSHGEALGAKDQFGDTPLHTAAVFGQTDLVRFLAEHGADLQAKNAAGYAPLDLAKKEHKDDTARLIEMLLARPRPATP